MPEIGDTRFGAVGIPPKPRSCYNHLGTSKVKFKSKSEAKAALKQMSYTTHRGKPMQRDAKVYRCSECNYYHIGHKS
jgi:hypothetical protein